MITPLSETVRSQIQSSIEIASLSDAVEQLLCNSLDADARNVRLEVDFKKGFCAIVDDGCGIPAQEFGEHGNLARPYCTSKSNQKTYYGKNGQSLACISALALVSVLSRTHNGQTHSMLFHHSKCISSGLAAEDAADDMKSSGTKVVVHNLFGNYPVRFKAHAARSSTTAEVERQFRNMKRRLAGYMLSFPKAVDLRLSIRDTNLRYHHKATSARNRRLSFSADVVRSVLEQASLVAAPRSASWKVASAKAGGLAIRVAISMATGPSKEGQFISLAAQPIQRAGLGAVLYDKINEVFDASDFGTSHEAEPEKHAHLGAGPAPPKSVQARLRDRHTSRTDRWPCFYVRIDTHSDELIAVLSSRNEGDQTGHGALQHVVNLLATLVEQVLQGQQPRRRHSQPARPTDEPEAWEHSPASRTAFDGWSRARAAYPAKVENICEGLPFVAEREASSQEEPIDPDVQLLLDDMRLDSGASTPGSILTPTNEGLSAGPGPGLVGGATAVDDCVTWRDPRTGKTIRLNNNGFVLPLTATATEQEGVGANTGGHKFSASPQRLSRKGRTAKDIVARLHEWSGHTFTSRPEVALPSVAIDFEATATTSEHSLSFTEQRVSASDLVCARVLGQVDQKFILVLTPTKDTGDNLVLIDQHAADERIKVEQLYRELCAAPAVLLTRPLILDSSEEEARRFEEIRPYFASWGIRYEIADNTIRVTHLPQLIAERCQRDPGMLVELLRKEVWMDRHRVVLESRPEDLSWVDRMAHCPAGVMEMVNSRACRTAIMFNDVLRIDQCVELVRSLARCTLPFQCAHGRPSLAVMTNVGYLDLGTAQDSQTSFAAAFKRWI